MATLTDYKGLDIVENATGDGGVALTDNFKELADRAPYQTSTNPGVNDDSTKGFSSGDQWLNTSTQVLWACVSNNTGAAVWKSILKRTASVLELIPEEGAEAVEVEGSMKVSGKIGIGRVAVNDALEVQQPGHSSGINLIGYGAHASRRLRMTLEANGNLLFDSNTNIYLDPNGGVIAINTGNMRFRTNTFLALCTNDSTVPAYSIGGQNVSEGKLVIGAGTGLSSPLAAMDQSGQWGFGPGFGATAMTATVDINSDKFRLRQAKTPASASDTGNQGDLCWDDEYVYVCIATDTWRRIPHATW
ncbi:MAG TPA: hypothetical protein VNQ76_06005 [Planctomicrobium sp.]|nr:hypothetical protein [Planctomicrobium sp.]